MPDHMKPLEERLQEQTNEPAMENRLIRCIEIQSHLTEALTVKFGAEIQPDGEIVYVTIEKLGQRINLTANQANSLAAQIRRRIAF